jgi:hypothetical protein
MYYANYINHVQGLQNANSVPSTSNESCASDEMNFLTENDTNWVTLLNDALLDEINNMFPLGNEIHATQNAAPATADTSCSVECATDLVSVEPSSHQPKNDIQPAFSQAPGPVTIKISSCSHPDRSLDSCCVATISCSSEWQLRQIANLLPGKAASV